MRRANKILSGAAVASACILFATTMAFVAALLLCGHGLHTLGNVILCFGYRLKAAAVQLLSDLDKLVNTHT